MGFCPWAAVAGDRGRSRLKLWQPNSRSHGRNVSFGNLLRILCSFASSLPRHSATLLKNKLLIFGGRRSSLYLSDMHILDLGKKVSARWMPWEGLF